MDTSETDFRWEWHPTTRNHKMLTAEQALICFHEGVLNGKNIVIEEFLLSEFIARKPKEAELFHEHWIDAFDLRILHSSSNEVAQFVCEFTCLHNEGYSYHNYKIITLQKQVEDGFWKISSVYRLLLNKENIIPTPILLLGRDAILLDIQTFIENKHDWFNDENGQGLDDDPTELVLEICKERVAGFDRLPYDIKQFYMDAVTACYDDDTQLSIDFLEIGLN